MIINHSMVKTFYVRRLTNDNVESKRMKLGFPIDFQGKPFGFGITLWRVVSLLFCLQLVHVEGRTHRLSMAHIRNPLVRSVYNRMLTDQEERTQDHSYWYSVNVEKLDEELCSKFVQMFEDDETKEFLDQCFEKSDWIPTQLMHNVLLSVMSWFMTRTSINGFLGRGSMFVYSKQQFQTLMGVEPNHKWNKLIDLGAGDGMVTKLMAPHFEEVYATEVSSPMRSRLTSLGYTVLDIDEWANHTKYDVIGCLNLLDRCDRPMTLLHQMKAALVPDIGRIVLAVVIPFKPYVELTADNRPSEVLHIQGRSFEEQISSFNREVFRPAGLEVERLTRLPYLCEGDLEKSYYFLYDAVFVLKAVS